LTLGLIWVGHVVVTRFYKTLGAFHPSKKLIL
jgi:hypothetical protein